MIDYIQIGKRIRYYRIKRGLTQESLAFEIHTSAAYVSCIERGTKKPSLQKLVEIAEILELSVEDLIPSPSQGQGAPHNLKDLVIQYPDRNHTNLLKDLTEIITILKLSGRY